MKTSKILQLVSAVSALVISLSIAATPVYAAGVYAATDLNGVIDSLRNGLVAILAGLATLFLTVGGLRYMMASGDHRQLQQGKDAIKSALIGYALAALAPVLVDILRRVIGA